MGPSVSPATDAKRGYFVSSTPLTVLVQPFCVEGDYKNGFCLSIRPQTQREGTL